MRCLLVALGLIASTCGAFAQDFELPTLRGSEGFMASFPGVSPVGGASTPAAKPAMRTPVRTSPTASTTSPASLCATASSNPLLRPLRRSRKPAPMAAASVWFAGYDSQWEGVILGFEVNYNRTTLNVGASDSVSLRIANDATAPAGHHFFYDPFTVSGQATIRITDIATFRARGDGRSEDSCPMDFSQSQWRAPMSRALPRCRIRARTSLIPRRRPTPPIVPLPAATFGPVTQTEIKNAGFYYGYAGGLGIDICVMPNVFLRGEWEFVQIPVHARQHQQRSHRHWHQILIVRAFLRGTPRGSRTGRTTWVQTPTQRPPLPPAQNKWPRYRVGGAKFARGRVRQRRRIISQIASISSR